MDHNARRFSDPGRLYSYPNNPPPTANYLSPQLPRRQASRPVHRNEFPPPENRGLPKIYRHSTEMSVIATFDKRVKHEQNVFNDILSQSILKAGGGTEGDKSTTISGDIAAQLKKVIQTNLSDPPEFTATEQVRPSTLALEMAAYERHKAPSDLDNAIKYLLKAEILNKYDNILKAAEDAAKSVPPALAEQAAIFAATNFKFTEVTKKKSILQGEYHYKPIEIISYLGTTKPIN